MAPVADITQLKAALPSIGKEGIQAHEVDTDGMLYPDYYPYADDKEHLPDTEPFEFHDPALRADPGLPIFKQPGVILEDYTPKMGTKITGLQLADLDEAGLDQLALLTAQRGFVIFGSRPGLQQTWADCGIPRQLEIARHFGKLQQHATLPRAPSSVEVSIVYQDKKNLYRKIYYGNVNSNILFHHDQSFEPQPPGVTLFTCLETAPSGGDTLFANCAEAYERLSPKFKELCLGLRVVHSSMAQVANARRLGGASRRDVIETAHPVVLEHPVTGQKALFVDGECVTHIEGLKKEESQALLKFLYQHIAYGQDFQARVKWSQGDCCLWDQRHIMHSATVDSPGDARRHFFRITPLSGVPKMATSA